MQSLYKGRSVSNAAGVKRWAIALSLLLPAVIAFYDAVFSALSGRFPGMLTTEQASILLAGLSAFVNSVLHVISTPKLGLDKSEGPGLLDDPEMLRRRAGESDL